MTILNFKFFTVKLEREFYKNTYLQTSIDFDDSNTDKNIQVNTVIG